MNCHLIKTIPWTLWVVGDGSKKNELERLAKDLNLRERIIFLGARKNIPEILSGIDIFAFPSLWEGLGLAALEAAAACGLSPGRSAPRAAPGRPGRRGHWLCRRLPRLEACVRNGFV